MMLLFAGVASATTLEEVVARAAEVDPDALVADLSWRRQRLDALEAWSQLGPTPSVSVGRTWIGETATDDGSLTVTTDLLVPGAWLDAAQESAQTRTARWTAEATTLDVQYFAAALYYEVLSAQAALEAAKHGEELARATAEATRARVGAGLESELLGRSADIGLLQAQAEMATAEAGVAIARARLARAVEMEVGDLSPAEPPPLPTEEADSPWLRAAEANVGQARMEHWQRLAEILPSGYLQGSTGLPAPGDWTVSLGLTWQLDGVIGPFVRARAAKIDQDIAEVQRDGLERDLQLLLVTAEEDARAAGRVAEAARAREKLSEEALKVGQTRLGVGLASSLEVLRLQDEAATARADRVAAELAEALARLEARRVAGVAWAKDQAPPTSPP